MTLVAMAVAVSATMGVQYASAATTEGVPDIKSPAIEQAEMRGEIGKYRNHHMPNAGMEQRKTMPALMSNEDFAARMAAKTGVAEKTILDALTNGTSRGDIATAAEFSKISKKSFTEVMQAKADTGNWKTAMEKLGLTPDVMKTYHQAEMAKMIAKKVNVEESVASNLLKEGYHSVDIEMAALLAKDSNKDIKDLLEMRRINNTWQDVASKIGIDKEQFMKIRQTLFKTMQHNNGLHKGQMKNHENMGWHKGQTGEQGPTMNHHKHQKAEQNQQ